jgi:hypothetical protein
MKLIVAEETSWHRIGGEKWIVQGMPILPFSVV